MAAKPYSYIKLVIAGSISSVQTWSTAVNMGLTVGTPSFADMHTWLTASKALVNTWWTATNSVNSINPSDVSLDEVRGYFYPAGSAVATVQDVIPFSPKLFGGSIAYAPTQCSLVVSLGCDIVGRHYRGRMYIPATGVTMGGSHQIGSTPVDGVANATKALLVSMNTTPVGGIQPSAIVTSQTPMPQAITKLHVNTEIDIQRRRADQIAPLYTKNLTVP